MERFVNGDIHDAYFREKLLNTFVNKIELYNDKIAIADNIGDGYLHDKYNSICICPYLVETRRVELLSENTSDSGAPGAGCDLHSLALRFTNKP